MSNKTDGAKSVGEGAGVVTKIQYGQIIGVDDSARSGTRYWLGVPFAKPPVGALRWKAPRDPDPWSEPRATRRFGNASVQVGRIYGPGANNAFDATIVDTLNKTVGSEDCLYLNIWRPATDETGLPVIFFIHGGSNLTGFTADPCYDGANLARTANAVVVTTNYRLGIFGWLAVPQLRTGDNALDDSGNFGTLDTLKALQFVHQNIAAFGGDPGNVTLCGESAGGLNVLALMASPLTQGGGLFHRAAIFSGGISLPGDLPPGALPALMPESFYTAQGEALVRELLIADGKATDAATATDFLATQSHGQIADYLRAKTPDELFAVLLGKLTPARLATSNPIPEGVVFPPSAIAAFKAGNYVRVPLLFANMRDEGKLFQSLLAFSPALGGKPGFKVGDATRFKMMFNFDPDAPSTLTVDDLIDPAYLPVDQPVTGYNARLEVITRLLFDANRDNMIGALHTQQPDIWFCRIDWDKLPPPWNDVFGAAHGFDLPFWFGNFGPNIFSQVMNTTANEGGRMALANAMMTSLGAFARSGDPNHSSLGVNWPVWPAKLIFDASLTDTDISVQ